MNDLRTPRRAVVFHTASPFFYEGLTAENADAKMVAPSLHGTRNVLGAVARSGSVARVVITSSRAAVAFHAPPARPRYTEADWSNEAYCRAAGHWYPLSKTLAEREAWAWAAEHPRVRLVAVNPTLVLGPLQRAVLNTSLGMVQRMLQGHNRAVPAGSVSFVDVRDVVAAHVAAAVDPGACGRYLCVPRTRPWAEVVDALREARPRAPLPAAAAAPQQPSAEPVPQFSEERARELGVTFRDVSLSSRCAVLHVTLRAACR